MSTRAVAPRRDWQRRPTQWRSTPTKTTSSRLPLRQVDAYKAARDWLDALTAPEPGEQVPNQDDHPFNPQTRTTTETALREAMQALVRVQAHMLARIVVEIRAADIAVELEPQLWYTVMSSMLTTPTSVPVAPEC
jgi:hypothetical protein